MDQTIEETINKDTQTPGGAKGFSIKRNAVTKYCITADDRAKCVRQRDRFSVALYATEERSPELWSNRTW